MRLEQAGGVVVVGECGSGREAVDAIREHAPDVVFLDVQMPGLDGFGVVEAIGASAMPVTVFVTAFDAHALRAFEAQALDYLLKPIRDERFARALDRARARVQESREGDFGRAAAALVQAPPMAPTSPVAPIAPAAPVAPAAEGTTYETRLLVDKGSRVAVVLVDEIDWIEAAGDYVRIHAGPDTHLLRQTTARMEARLDPSRFVRIHRSTIVNVARIRELRPQANRDCVIVLQNGTHIKASRSYRDRLAAAFGADL